MFSRYAIFIVVMLIIILSGCSSVTVSTDYDPAADFSKFKTYTWSSVKDSTDILAKNELLLHRVYKAIDKSLQSKDFTKVESNPDIIIYPHAITKERAKIDTWDYGYSAWWGNDPYGMIGNDVSTNITYYIEGSLLIDIVSAADSQLVWRGVGTGFDDTPSSPKESTENIIEVVTKILKEYPPQQKNDEIDGGLL